MLAELKSFHHVCIEVMRERFWHERLGKQKEYVQSLLDHSMAVVSTGLTMIQHGILPEMSQNQTRAFLLALAVHDAGKEHPEFQEYIQGKGPHISHTDIPLSRDIAYTIADRMGWELSLETMEAAVSLHMKSRDTNASNLFEVLKKHEDHEWAFMAQYVQEIDQLASAKSPRAAIATWNRSKALSKIGRVSYHSVRLRGVSSVYLHDALKEAYKSEGWQPLIYYPFGTLYVSKDHHGVAPSAQVIRENLRQTLRDVLSSVSARKVKLMHGSIIGTYFVKPDLFNLDDLRPLLVEASKRISELPATKVPDDVILPYKNIQTIWAATGDLKTAKKANQRDPVKLRSAIDEDLHGLVIFDIEDLSAEEQLKLRESVGVGRIEIAILKMFKNVMVSILDESQLPLLETYYDRAFGKGAFEALLSTANLMPAVDMALTVDVYWKRHTEQLGNYEPSIVGLLEKGRRRELLIDTLVEIANRVFLEAQVDRSVEALVEAMTEEFLQDLEYPIQEKGIAELAFLQLEASRLSKLNVNSAKKVPHLCPMCNNQFTEGVPAIADLINKATAFSNRIKAYGQNKYYICKTCYFERLLQQLLLGGKVGEFICVIPSTHVSDSVSEELDRQIQEFEACIRNFTEGEGSMHNSCSLSMENMIAPKAQQLRSELTSSRFAEVFSYTKSEKRQKEERKKLEAAIEDQFVDLAPLNEYLQEEYQSFAELVEDLYQGKHIEDEAFAPLLEQVHTTPPIKAIYKTPNFMLFPTLPSMQNESAIMSDTDGEAKYAYKQLFIACLFAEYLGMSVAMTTEIESVHLLVEKKGGGQVYIPNHARVRKAILESRKNDRTTEWLFPTEVKKWREAIQAAILLQNSVEFSQRDDIPRILSFSEPGELIRRIQMKKGNHYDLKPYEWKCIEQVKEVWT